ncbi:MAG: fibronectin type III domain-containing protein [Ruminococcus sp.]|nr:fibronectin type III domain-containing protein [Ruminococcus sp.]
MNITQSETISSVKNVIKGFVAILAVVTIYAFFSTGLRASAAVKSLSKPTIVAEKKYDSAATHPYNKQTNTIIVDWNNIKNAKSYELYIKGGKYTKWTKYKTVSSSKCTVSGLERCKNYKFKVRAVNGSVKSDYSAVKTIKTARIDFDQKGWEAICRVVSHEVGGCAGDVWDKPIVYASDCIVNQYVAAKYTKNAMWSSYYKKYNSIQDILYKSGGFISDSGLNRDGSYYSKVTARVKTAVYGAIYAKAALKGICNDFGIYWWCNRSYKINSSKVSYCFKIPWGGYGYFWNKYWG